MPQSATQFDFSGAMQTIKDMDLWGEEWADPRELGRTAWQELLNEALRGHRDQRLRELLLSGGQDRRNGYYRRDLLTTLGVIELRIPLPGRSASSRWWPATRDGSLCSIGSS